MGHERAAYASAPLLRGETSMRVRCGAACDAGVLPAAQRILFVSAAVPMIGFGFMDNMVMITMGMCV